MTPAELAKTHAAAFPVDQVWGEGAFASILSQSGMILSGDVFCFVLGRVTLDEAEILTLATDPAFQRQGHAKVALAAFEQTAQENGTASVFLEVAADNLAAQALYASAGYEQVGQRRNYYKRSGTSGVDALVLKKRLT